MQIYRRDDLGSVNVLVLHGAKGDSEYPRVYSDASAWNASEQLEGKYYSEEVQTTYEIMLRDDHLFATSMQNEDVLLKYLENDHFIGDKWWWQEMRVIRNSEGEVTGIRINADTNWVQNLLFEKI